MSYRQSSPVKNENKLDADLSCIFQKYVLICFTNGSQGHENSPACNASPTVSIELKFPVELNSFSEKMNSVKREITGVRK